MTRFKVRCYIEGHWDHAEPRDIEAESKQEAAETACGESLTDGGKLGQLRAKVWQPSSPQEMQQFYVTATG